MLSRRSTMSSTVAGFRLSAKQCVSLEMRFHAEVIYDENQCLTRAFHRLVLDDSLPRH